MNSSSPVRSQMGPYITDVEAGKSYLWCACGRSTTQPFCDNEAHKGTPFLPVRYVAKHTMKIFFCGCKETRVRPLCDSMHTKLSEYDSGKSEKQETTA